MTVMPEFEPELCDDCGLCIVACHGGAIVWEKGKVRIVESQSCDFCAVCEAVCPQNAITCSYSIVISRD